jgi:uncharacterized membrane protein
MSDLVAVAFNDESKAEKVRRTLIRLQAEYLIDMADAVAVVRGQDGKVLHTSLTWEDEEALQKALDACKDADG